MYISVHVYPRRFACTRSSLVWRRFVSLDTCSLQPRSRSSSQSLHADEEQLHLIARGSPLMTDGVAPAWPHISPGDRGHNHASLEKHSPRSVFERSRAHTNCYTQSVNWRCSRYVLFGSQPLPLHRLGCQSNVIVSLSLCALRLWQSLTLTGVVFAHFQWLLF